MALTQIKAAALTADLIDETKLADNSIDSEHYNDGSIDNAHLADDAVGVAELSATGTASSSTFLRGDNSWATPTDTDTVTTINNNADNRVITGSGTANTLEGESSFTCDSNGDVLIGTSSWSYKKPLNVQGSTGAILSLANYDTTTYAADTHTGIEFRVNTGNTGNQNGSCEIRAFKENGTNGNNARGLSFYTAGNGASPAERMRVTSDGIVTQPYKPSFFATINGGDNTTNSGVTVPFDNAKHNTGNHYDTSSYKFIAPVTGVYYFCTQIWAKNGTNNVRFRFVVDDASNSYAADNITQNGFHGNSVNREDFGYNASVVWYLAEGDRFYIQADNTNLTYYTAGASDPHTYFCGFLVG